MDLATIQTILGIATSILVIIGVPFAIYKMYNRDQQSDGQIAANLASEIKLLRTELVLKIQGLTDSFNLIKANDLHEIHEKMRDHDDEMNKFRVSLEKLTTIIDERVPRKTVDKVT